MRFRDLQDLEKLQDAPEAVGTLVGFSALVAIFEHFIGLVDVLFLLVAISWFVDMVGGTARSFLKGYRGEQEAPTDPVEDTPMACGLANLSWEKAMEGILKIVGIGMAVIVFGSFEILQVEVTHRMIGDDVYIPAVAPILSIAIILLWASILDQVLYFWRSFGTRVLQFAGDKIPGIDGEDS